MTITTITEGHAGSALAITTRGQAVTGDVGHWSLFGGEVTFSMNDLMRNGGSLAEFDAATSEANVTIPCTVSASGTTINLPHGRVLATTQVNRHLIGAETTAPPTPVGPQAGRVSLYAGVYACTTHPTEHFFLLGEVNGSTGTGGVAQLRTDDGHGSIGRHGNSFATYSRCRPVQGADLSVLFGGHSKMVTVNVAADQFPHSPRLAEPRPF